MQPLVIRVFKFLDRVNNNKIKMEKWFRHSGLGIISISAKSELNKKALEFEGFMLSYLYFVIEFHRGLPARLLSHHPNSCKTMENQRSNSYYFL